MYGLPGFPGGESCGERTEISCAVAFFHAPDYFQSGEGLLLRKPEHDVLLVVAQADVVVRTVLLDEAGLEKKRLLFRGGGEKLYARRTGRHGPGLGGELILGTKIGEHPLAQIAGLAHIDDPPLRVLIDIDAGRGRKS